MNGSVFYPLSAQIADTVAAHGFAWAASYYVNTRKVPAKEFFLLAKGAGLIPSITR